MNSRIRTSFGLALMLAIGVIAAMLAFGLFTTPGLHAGDAITLDHVVNATVNSPITPGDSATFTIKFQNQSDLTAGSGQLYVKFDKNISVPSAIERERITISASGATGVSTSNPLFDPTVTADTSGNPIVVITIGDTDPSTSGTQHLLAWDTDSTNSNKGHILQFSALAGLKNSTSASTSAAWVDMSDDGVNYNGSPTATSGGTSQKIPVYRWLKLSSSSGARGKVITVTGKAWKTGTANVFLDEGVGSGNTGAGNRALDSGEPVLAQSDAAISGGAFTASFTVDTNFDVGNNSINVIDGTGVSAGAPDIGPRYHTQNFTLRGNIVLDKTATTRGGSLKITLEDFGGSTGSGSLTSITIGGVAATLPLVRSYSNHSASYTITIPSTTPLGTQRLSLSASNESAARTATVTVAGLVLTVSPSPAVANQSITVSGTGYTASENVADGGLTVGGVEQDTLTNGSAETTVQTDNSGNLVASFAIPNNHVTRTPGTHVIRITDDSNAVGEATLTVPERVITIDPAESRRGSTVAFTGSGFVASKTVTITFLSGTTTTTVATVTADSSGSVSGTFDVPTSAGIPSTNTVTATSAYSSSTDGNETQLTGTVTHNVSGATVALDPSSAASGQIIAVDGTGFPGFVSLSALTIGGVSALPTPAPSTDGEGGFVLTALVPELSTGSHSLVATVGTSSTAVTATTSFTVVVTPTVVASNDTDVTFADEITSDNLVRVWKFNNADQTWAFFDPRPAFAAANTFTATTSGDIVWVNVTEETTFQGATLYPGWNLISLSS